MTQYEMTENLSEKCDVTLEEAKTALEASDWNTLTATHLLEKEKFRRMQELYEFAESGTATAVQAAPEEAAAEDAATEEGVKIEVVEVPEHTESKKSCHGKALKNLGEHIRRLLACGNRNRFTVQRGEEQLLTMPVTALAILLLCAFWVCVPLLVIGLFAGCRYSFSGKELGRESINNALGKAADAADSMKRAAAKA